MNEKQGFIDFLTDFLKASEKCIFLISFCENALIFIFSEAFYLDMKKVHLDMRILCIIA